jgi:hypothetical protein
MKYPKGTSLSEILDFLEANSYNHDQIFQQSQAVLLF